VADEPLTTRARRRRRWRRLAHGLDGAGHQRPVLHGHHHVPVNWGIHHVPASRAGVFLNIEPALGSWLA